MEKKPLVLGDLIAKVPIVQGGMGVGISLSSLAGAVAAAGGIGIISTAQIGYLDEEFEKFPIKTNLRVISEQVKKARAIANGGIIGVNIMAATRNYEDYVHAAVNAGVDLIVSGAGLPTILPALVGNSKTKIAPIVSSLKATSVICRVWEKKYEKTPDMVVIEGPRAGGHLGFSVDELERLEELDFDKEISQIIDFVKNLGDKHRKNIPVVVGGGIYNKEDMEHYLMLGADGVQIATRFVTTYECDADIKYKMAYINASKDDIRIVKSPVGMPGRAIWNSFIKETLNGPVPISKCYQCLSHCNAKDIPYCITTALINAAKGDIDHALLFCGEKAYKATELEHVEDIIKELMIS